MRSSRVNGQVRVGISGWTYPPWRGKFYPPDLPHRRELEFAARQVSTIEINGTFYSLQRPEYFRAWAAAVPDDFIFAVKGGRFITHIRRLKEVATPLANFFASGPLELGGKLGPFLWQLPPSLRYDRGRLEEFFNLLPRDSDAAFAMASGHDERLAGRASLAAPAACRPLRHALEVRHASFETEEFVELLRAHRIGLVVADAAGKWPMIEDVTADFMYVRLHGAEELYVSGYTPEALDLWARKVAGWSAGRTPRQTRRLAAPAARQARDVFVFFDNDAKVFAPYDAIGLAERLHLRGPQPLPDEPPRGHRRTRR